MEYQQQCGSNTDTGKIIKIEKTQTTATKMVSKWILSFISKTIKVGTDVLKRKKVVRGDTIALFRTIKGVNKNYRNYLFLWDRSGRGHERKLKKTRQEP